VPESRMEAGILFQVAGAGLQMSDCGSQKRHEAGANS